MLIKYFIFIKVIPSGLYLIQNTAKKLDEMMFTNCRGCHWIINLTTKYRMRRDSVIFYHTESIFYYIDKYYVEILYLSLVQVSSRNSSQVLSKFSSKFHSRFEPVSSEFFLSSVWVILQVLYEFHPNFFVQDSNKYIREFSLDEDSSNFATSTILFKKSLRC